MRGCSTTRMKHPTLLAALCLLTGSCTGIPDRASDASPASTITLASWNMEHLAERNDSGCRPRSDADYAESAAQLATVDPAQEQATDQTEQWLPLGTFAVETSASDTSRPAVSGHSVACSAAGNAARPSTAAASVTSGKSK